MQKHQLPGPLVTPQDGAVPVAENANEEITFSHGVRVECVDLLRTGTEVLHTHALPTVKTVERLKHRLPVFSQILAHRTQEAFPDRHTVPSPSALLCKIPQRSGVLGSARVWPVKQMREREICPSFRAAKPRSRVGSLASPSPAAESRLPPDGRGNPFYVILVY